MSAVRQLTDQQQRFLNVLFDSCDGDIKWAMREAGYSDNLPSSTVTRSLKSEILEKTKEYLACQAPQAATKLVGVMSDPTRLGNKELMIAAQQVLDRIGVIKTEGIQVQSANGVMILPPKKEELEDDE